MLSGGYILLCRKCSILVEKISYHGEVVFMLHGSSSYARYIYYLPAGRSVLRKTVPEVLSTARGRRPRAVLKTEHGPIRTNTDRPRPANNIFIFFLLFFKS